jgi:hypothetical protein
VKEIGTEVSCLSIASVPPGRLGSQFLSVGDWSGTVKILSLDADKLLVQLSIMDLPVKYVYRSITLSLSITYICLCCHSLCGIASACISCGTSRLTSTSIMTCFHS